MTTLPRLFPCTKSMKQTNNDAAAAVRRSDNLKTDCKNRNAQDSKMGGLRNFTSPKLYHSSSKSVERKVNPKQAKLVNSPASSIHEERKFCSAGPKRKIKSSALRTPSSKIGIFDKEPGSMQERFGRRSNEKKLNKFQPSNLSPCVSAGNWLKNLTMRKVGSSCSKVPKQILKNRMTSLGPKTQKDERKAEKANVVSDIKKNVNEVKGLQIDLNFEENNLQLVDLYGEDDHLIPLAYRENLPLSEIFNNVNENVKSKPRRQSFLRRSLAWDSAFVTSAGLLNLKELSLVNEGFKRTQKDAQRSKDATKIVGSQSNAPSCKKRKICSQSKVKSVGASKSRSPNLRGTIMYHQDKLSKLFSSSNNAASVKGTENVITENKTRTAQDSKMSRSGGLPKSTSFTSKTENFHRKSQLFNSPSSVLHFPLSSSPTSSVDSCFSETLSPYTITHQNTIPILDFESPNTKEIKFTSQNGTKAIKSSGLRMPSPRIGFFDKESGSTQFVSSSNLSRCVSTNNCLKDGKHLIREHDERKVGSSCSKLKSCGKISKQILNKNLHQKYDGGSFHAKKENVCSFKDLVTALSRQLEVTDLARDMEQVGGQWVYQVSKPDQLFDLATANEHSTVY